jgi:hypothetical protein
MKTASFDKHHLQKIITEVENTLRYVGMPDEYCSHGQWYIAGGAVGSMVRNEAERDIDVFFRTAGCLLALDAAQWNKVTHCETKNSITIPRTGVSFVKRRFGEPVNVVNRFDFLHTQLWIDADREVHAISEEALKCVRRYRVALTPWREEVACYGSIIRALRLREKGWDVPDSVLRRLLSDYLDPNKRVEKYETSYGERR